MQKKLIALAITAAFASAPAFADTTVYGLVDGGFGSKATTDQTTGAATSGDKTTVSGITFSQNQTTRFGIKSTEDLGNGMKAGFQVEMGLAGNSTYGGSISADRVLAGSLDFGQGTTVTIGKMSSPFRGIVYSNDAMYGANFVGNLITNGESLVPSAVNGGFTTKAGLNQRVVAADVAQKFGAVTASVGLINNTTKVDSAAPTEAQAGNGVEVTAVYKQDALSVSGGYRTQKTTAGSTATPTTDTTDKMLILAANYDFGVAKVYGEYGSHDSTDNTAAAQNLKVTMESVGVNMPITSALAGYVQVGTGKADAGAGGTNPKFSAAAVGARYSMSKNTFAYIHYGTQKLDTISKVDQMGVGLVHSF
jgi:predicted porin